LVILQAVACPVPDRHGEAALQARHIALRRLNLPTDARYLALADLRGVELWTIDRRLMNACQQDRVK